MILLPRKLRANQLDEFIGGWQTSCLLFRIDAFAVDEDIQLSRGTGAQLNRDVEFTFNIVLEAHGLRFDVASNEAALDLDVHVLPNRVYIEKQLFAEQGWAALAEAAR